MPRDNGQGWYRSFWITTTFVLLAAAVLIIILTLHGLN